MNKQEIQKNIDNMKAELAKMEAQLKECEKIELEDGDWYISGDGNVILSTAPHSKLVYNIGATRSTKELAEVASKNMVVRNKLEAYVHQIQGNGEGNHSIRLSSFDELYKIEKLRHNIIGAVKMHRNTAETICEWLNDGRIEL